MWSEAAGGQTIAECAEHHYAQLVRERQDLVLADPGERQLFDDRVYKRGALLLESLRRTVGDDVFRAVLRRWASKYRHRLVGTEDFLAVVEEVAGSPTQADLWTAWLHEKPLPPLPPVASATPPTPAASLPPTTSA